MLSGTFTYWIVLYHEQLRGHQRPLTAISNESTYYILPSSANYSGEGGLCGDTTLGNTKNYKITYANSTVVNEVNYGQKPSTVT